MAVEPVSRMAVSWDVPHITYSGSDEFLGNKKVFSMLTRTGLTVNAHIQVYIQLLDEFGWTDVAIIYDVSKGVHNMTGANLQVILLHYYNVFLVSFLHFFNILLYGYIYIIKL